MPKKCLMTKSTWTILLLSIAINCNSQTTLNYNLNKPDKTIVLPEILNEVSGIALLDNENLACVQDELGAVFIFNTTTEKMVARYQFEATGDFEGLAFTGNSLFILRSDGRLSEWTDFSSDKGGNELNHYNLPLITKDNEGLCYDKKNNRLLIAGKSKPMAAEAKTSRIIYAFDLTSKTLATRPAHIINTVQLEKKSMAFNLEPREQSAKGKTKSFNFRPAGLEIHPQTGEIFIISSSDKLLIVLNEAGSVVHMESLNARRFPQPEAITFMSDGTMIITSEAAGKVATLQIFNNN